jgi:phosphatidylglycerophosphate synthase
MERRGNPPRRTRGRLLAALIIAAIAALVIGVLYPDALPIAGIVVAAAVLLWLYPWFRFRVRDHRNRAT